MITYPVVEKFVSINGEGQKAGEIAAFIRMRSAILPAITVILPGPIQKTALVNFYLPKN